MAIRWMDGFDYYGASGSINANLARTYTISESGGTDNLTAATGRYTGKCVSSLVSGTTNSMKVAISSSGVTSFIIGFNFKIPSINYDGEFYVGKGTYNSANGLRLVYDDLSFAWNIYLNNTLMGTQPNFTSWHHMELVIPITPSGGTPCRCILDGVEIGTTTSSWSWDGTLQIYMSNSMGCDFYFDDLYVMDNTGSTNNAPIASTLYVPRIEYLVPTSDITMDFSLTGGASGNAITSQIPFESADYLQSTTNGNKALMGLSDITNITNVNAVCATCFASESVSATTSTFKFLMNNGTDTEVGSTMSVTGSLISTTPYSRQLFDVSPLTSSGWTVSEINSLKSGIINKT